MKIPQGIQGFYFGGYILDFFFKGGICGKVAPSNTSPQTEPFFPKKIQFSLKRKCFKHLSGSYHLGDYFVKPALHRQNLVLKTYKLEKVKIICGPRALRRVVYIRDGV